MPLLSRLGRLGVVALLLAGAGLAAWWIWTANEASRLARELAALEAEMAARIAERDAMIERLSLTRRTGIVEVLAQTLDERGRVNSTTIEFIELDEDGREIGRTRATVPGATVFIDAWTVKFDRHLVAEGDPLRGRTLILLRRVYSEDLAPAQGIPIDTPGSVPDGYAAGDLARFERELWSQFWRIAADPDLAAAFGVRVAQGEAVYRPVVEGDRYEFVVDAAGGISLVPLARR